MHQLYFFFHCMPHQNCGNQFPPRDMEIFQSSKCLKRPTTSLPISSFVFPHIIELCVAWYLGWEQNWKKNPFFLLSIIRSLCIPNVIKNSLHSKTHSIHIKFIKKTFCHFCKLVDQLWPCRDGRIDIVLQGATLGFGLDKSPWHH
jgi:hypothetical protein